MTLACEALAYGYGRHTVGSGVSLAVAPGEVVCLLGPNGGGKTTLFKTLLGLLPAQGGSIRLGNDKLADLSRGEVARRVAYVPQAAGGYFPFSVREVVLMGRAAHLGAFTGPTLGDRQLAENAMARVGIAHLADAEFTRISGGERQLVLLARALAQAAQIIILDEPTANLDFGNQVRLLAEIKRLAADGRGILWATHAPDHALACADRVALVARGGVKNYGVTAEVVDADALSDLYGVAIKIRSLAGGDRRVCVAA